MSMASIIAEITKLCSEELKVKNKETDNKENSTVKTR